MAKFFKACFGGISFLIIYIITVMAAPIFLFILGYSEVTSRPTIFNLPLYVVEVRGETFFSEATKTGLLLSLVLGIIFYYLLPLLFPKKWLKTSD